MFWRIVSLNEKKQLMSQLAAKSNSLQLTEEMKNFSNEYFAQPLLKHKIQVHPICSSQLWTTGFWNQEIDSRGEMHLYIISTDSCSRCHNCEFFLEYNWKM